MDATYHAVCLKRDYFFLPSAPSLFFEVTMHYMVYTGLAADEMDSPVHLGQPLQIIALSWDRKRKKGSRMYFKEKCSGHSGKGGDPLVTFLITFYPTLTE